MRISFDGAHPARQANGKKAAATFDGVVHNQEGHADDPVLQSGTLL